MIIPLWVLLIPAAIIVALVIIFALINLLQLHRFGFFNRTAFVAFVIFVTLAGVVFMQTVGALEGVDWNAPLLTLRIGTSSDIISQ